MYTMIIRRCSFIVSFALFALFFNSCSRPQEKLQREIEREEAGLYVDSLPVPDQKKTENMIKLYLQYTDAYQDDTLSASYLFKAGELYVATGAFEKALETFGRVQRYPNYNKVASALFLQGFVAENHLHNREKAREYYEKFLMLYPDHELADDTRLMIQQLSLNPEELIEMFEEKNAAKDSSGNAPD